MTAHAVIREDARRIVAEQIPDAAALRGGSVLITGATGLIGGYVVETMLEIARQLDDEVAVLALARDVGKAHARFGNAIDSGRLRLVVGAVSDAASVQDLDVTHIVHAASPAMPSAFAREPVGVIEANVIGTRVLLDLATRCNAYLCFISTMEIYGEGDRTTPDAEVIFAEDDSGRLDSMDPRSAYPESKRVAENLCVAYWTQHGVRSDVVRLTHTYGPGAASSDDRVQAQFFRSAAAGHEIVLKSDGTLSRTYTYVADAASAVLTVLLTAATRERPTAFNVANESARTTIRRLAEVTLSAAGRPASDLVFDIPERPREMWSRTSGGTYVDCSRLRRLGWQARYAVEEGVARTMAVEMRA